jgi:CheY-like chemotaxis protein
MTTAKVLVIEDNPMNMELATDLIRIQGHEVLAARTAGDALNLLEKVRPDLILMDVQLPGLSGLELARRLKEDCRTRGIPIIAITAYAMMGDHEKALDAGCSGYISKPIIFKQFSRVIEDILASRRG